ncbi:MAG: signal peptide peptidase SppA [Deltaproteobacteria bacterium]
MDRRTLLIVLGAVAVAIAVFIAAAVFAVVAATGASGDDYGGAKTAKVGVVEIRGVIGSPDQILKDLRHFRDRDDIKAIVLRVDSPGGAVAPSQEIHDAIVAIVKKKPLVASMGNLAASGGFYVSVAAQKIYAEPGTLTGSIGVIADLPELDGLLDLAKVHVNVVKSGKFKDIGSPFRAMSDDDKRLFQALIDDVYGQFLTAVAEGRKLPVEKVRPIADGRVLTGAQAKALGLIDAFGGLEDAALAALALAKVEAKPKLVYPPEELELKLSDFLKQGSSAAAEGAAAGLRGRALPPMGLLFVSPLAEASSR